MTRDSIRVKLAHKPRIGFVRLVLLESTPMAREALHLQSVLTVAWVSLLIPVPTFESLIALHVLLENFPLLWVPRQPRHAVSASPAKFRQFPHLLAPHVGLDHTLIP